MKDENEMEQLLLWRLAEAEAEAPPAPKAGQLLDPACEKNRVPSTDDPTRDESSSERH
jgi:hypothetical protein